MTNPSRLRLVAPLAAALALVAASGCVAPAGGARPIASSYPAVSARVRADPAPRRAYVRPGDPRDRHVAPRSFYGGRGDSRWRYYEFGSNTRGMYSYPTVPWAGGFGAY